MSNPEPTRRQRAFQPWLVLLLVPALAMLGLLSHPSRTWLDAIATHSEPTTLLPGLTVERELAQPQALIVTSVRSGSNAARDGIAVGDAVIAIDGTPILTVDQARRHLQTERAGSVDLRIVHGSRQRNVRLGREENR